MEIYDIENLLCNEAIKEICQAGDNQAAVTKWTQHYLSEILRHKPKWQDFVSMLDGYGFEKTENLYEWIERAIWCAAWNVFETRTQMECGE